MRSKFARLLTRIAAKLDPKSDQLKHPYWDMVTHTSEDELFNKTYEKGEKDVGFRKSLWRRDRWYNLQAAVNLVKHLEGGFAECGTWKGLSALLVCTRVKAIDPGFRGSGVTLIDSFEGWSEPTAADGNVTSKDRQKTPPSVEDVKETLKDFPEVEIVKGWIPDVFSVLPERKYRFVHVDVNMADPTRAAFEYFYDRLVPGGIIICDDYGSFHWRGATAAIDAFCEKRKAPFFPMASGQILVQKPLSA